MQRLLKRPSIVAALFLVVVIGVAAGLVAGYLLARRTADDPRAQYDRPGAHYDPREHDFCVPTRQAAPALPQTCLQSELLTVPYECRGYALRNVSPGCLP
jgi:hypothetical protein